MAEPASELEVANTQVATLQGNVNELTAQLGTANTQVATLQGNVNELTAQLGTANAELKKQQEDTAALKQTLEEFNKRHQDEVEDLTRRLGAASEKVADLTQQREESNNQHDEHVAGLQQQLQESNNRCKDEVDQLTLRLAAATEEIAALRLQREESNRRQKDEVDRLAERLGAATETIADLTRQLEESNKQREEQVTDLTEQLDASDLQHQQQVANLDQQLDAANKQRQDEVVGLIQQLEMVTSSLTDLKFTSRQQQEKECTLNLQLQFWTTSQSQDESLHDYFARFQELDHKIHDVPDNDRVRAFINGVQPKTKTQLLARNPTNFQEVTAVLESLTPRRNEITNYDFVIDFTKRDDASLSSTDKGESSVPPPSVKVEAPADGWPIFLSDQLVKELTSPNAPAVLIPAHVHQPKLNERFIKYLNRACKESPVVVFFGLFNKGKTFLINLLTGANLPSESTIHTVGLSFLISKHGELPCVYVDSAGSHSPVFLPSETTQVHQAMLDQMAVSMMTQRALSNIATVHIAVLTELTLLDQDMIVGLETRLQSECPGNQSLIVVHNHMQANTENELLALLKNHVVNVHARLVNLKGAWVFVSSKKGPNKATLTTVHVPLANNNTTFGSAFNRKQAEYIIATIVTAKRANNISFWDHLQQCLGKTLKEFSMDKMMISANMPGIELHEISPVALKERIERIVEDNRLSTACEIPTWEKLEEMTEERFQEKFSKPYLLALKPTNYKPAEVKLNASGQFGATQNLSLSFTLIELVHDRVESEKGVAFVLSLPDLTFYALIPHEEEGWTIKGCLGGWQDSGNASGTDDPVTSEEEVEAYFQERSGIDWQYPLDGQMLQYAEYKKNRNTSATRPKGRFDHEIPFKEIGHSFLAREPVKSYENGILSIFFPRAKAMAVITKPKK